MPESTRIATSLAAALAAQRQAHAAQSMPTLAERQRDLDTLERFVHENQASIEEAISADYGHRSRHETLLTEIAPVLSGIKHAKAHLKAWMKPQRRQIDRLTFGLGTNRVLP